MFFQKQKAGATVTEFGLLLGLIAVLLIGSLTSVGNRLSAIFGQSETVLNRVVKGEHSPSLSVSGVTYAGAIGTHSFSVTVTDIDGVEGVSLEAVSADPTLTNIAVTGASPDFVVTYDISFSEDVSTLSLIAEDRDGNIGRRDLSLRTVYYQSCQDAYDAGERVDGEYSIDITGSGTPETYTCLMSREGGGWTELTNVDQSFGYVWTHMIPDIGLAYQELYFVAESDQVQDYGTQEDPAWDTVGFPNQHMVYVIDGVNYMTQTCTRVTSCSSVSYSLISSRVVVAEPSSDCLDNLTPMESCASEFILTVPQGHKLQQVTDVESLSGVNTNNDAYFHYTLYAR